MFKFEPTHNRRRKREIRLIKPKMIMGLILTSLALVAYGLQEIGDIDLYNIFQGEGDKYRVVSVVDGDTIKAHGEEGKVKVRFIGVDTPESVHYDSSKNVPEGKLASNFTRMQLLGKEVAIKFDKQKQDKYGRYLGYIYLEGRMFNRVLLEKGYARVMMFKPNNRYEREFMALEKEAREGRKGFWKKGAYFDRQVRKGG